MAPEPATFAGIEASAAERGEDAPRDADELAGRVEATLERAATDWSFVDADDISVARGFFETPATAGEVVERYWLSPPFAWAEIQRDADANAHRYHVREPSVDEFERYVREDVQTTLRSELRDVAFERSATGRDRFDDSLDDVLAAHARTVPPATRCKLYYYLRRDCLGYDVVDPFMRDPYVEDVSCDGYDVPVYVYHREYGNVRANRAFSEGRLDSLAMKLAQRAGRHLSAAKPVLTTSLPDGSRMQVSLGDDVPTKGSNFTVRKFRERPFTPPELVEIGTFSLVQMAYLWLAIEHNASIIFAGPTASGKTTSLNAASAFIPPDDKVVTVEETRELQLPHDDWVADVTREADFESDQPEIDMYTLLSEALHQRPDYILVGEIRTDPDVVLAFMQAVGTGHEGFTTFHADSAEEVIRRLSHNPLSVPPELLTDVDVVVVQQLLELDDGSERRCRQLVEVTEADDPNAAYPKLSPIFEFDPYDEVIEQVESSRLLAEVARGQGWDRSRLERKLDQRRRLLAGLIERETFEYDAVTDAIFRFARSPESVVESVGVEPDGGRLDVAWNDG